MELKFNVDAFLPILSQVASVVLPKNSMPILGDILLEARQDTKSVYLTASDGDTWLTMESASDENIGESIRACINSNDFVSTMRNLAGMEVTLEFDDVKHVVKGKHNKGHFTMPYQDASEYPMAQSMGEDVQEVAVQAAHICSGIDMSEYATANDEIRPILNGVHFDFANGALVCVATDGHKLTRFTIDEQGKEGEFKFTLPKKPAHIFMQLLSKETSDVEIKYTQQNVTFTTPRFKLVTRLYEARYPNYNAVIPQESTILLGVESEDILNAIKRITPMSGNIGLVILDVVGTTITISAEDYDLSKSAVEYVMCEHEGDDIRIGFNASMLYQTIKNIRCDRVNIGLTAPERTGVFKPSVEQEGCEHTAILMPVKIH